MTRFWSQFPLTFPFRFGTKPPPKLPTLEPASPAATVIDDHQIVSIHTHTGVQLYQFLANDLIDLTWTRTHRTPSRCEINIPPTLDYHRMPDLVPWQHWMSVWDNVGQELYWTGPIQKVAANRDTMTITGRDMSALFTRTRCPITKRWDATDPATIAADLINATIDHHNLTTTPIVRADPLGDRFDYRVTADERMLDSHIDELANLGLHWTVTSGTPVLGPMPRQPVAALNEHDFVGGGVTVIRDGRQFYNDVLLRAADSIAQARVPLTGLNLQTIVNIDSMFGVGNADRAATQYARHVSTLRDTIVLPDNTTLHPNAPIHISQLIPTNRVTIDAYGMQVLMQITGVDVRYTAQESSVSVRLESVDDHLPELVQLENRNPITGI